MTPAVIVKWIPRHFKLTTPIKEPKTPLTKVLNFDRGVITKKKLWVDDIHMR